MYKKELLTGKEIVTTAMDIVKSIQADFKKQISTTKEDLSPVTIADYIAQAMICNSLNKMFPEIPIVAEESSVQLAGEPELLKQIDLIILKEKRLKNIEGKLFESIDLGQHKPGKNGTFWTLDPIDGTKGFMRNEQYSIALALIVEGEVVLGILGCPELKIPETGEPKGVIFYCTEDMPTRIFNTFTQKDIPATISTEKDFHKMRFVQSYVSSHSDIDTQHRIAESLKIASTPVQMDSQVKYGVIASGLGEIYLRIPHPENPDYKEKIWDHAAGSILVEMAGGAVSDISGKRLNFNCGRTLEKNRGILATSQNASSETLNALRKIKDS